MPFVEGTLFGVVLKGNQRGITDFRGPSKDCAGGSRASAIPG